MENVVVVGCCDGRGETEEATEEEDTFVPVCRFFAGGFPINDDRGLSLFVSSLPKPLLLLLLLLSWSSLLLLLLLYLATTAFVFGLVVAKGKSWNVGPRFAAEEHVCGWHQDEIR